MRKKMNLAAKETNVKGYWSYLPRFCQAGETRACQPERLTL